MIDIVRADGFVAHDVRPLVRLNVQIVAKDGSRRETGSHGLGGRYLYDSLFDETVWSRTIAIALAQALTNLGRSLLPPARCRSCSAPAGWSASARGGRPRARGRLQPQGHVGLFRTDRRARRGARVTVIDDGAIASGAGRLTIDDEGTPTGRTVLIEDGILKAIFRTG